MIFDEMPTRKDRWIVCGVLLLVAAFWLGVCFFLFIAHQSAQAVSIFVPLITDTRDLKKGIAPSWATHPEDWTRTGSTWGYVYQQYIPLDQDFEGVEMIPLLDDKHPELPIRISGAWLLGQNEPDRSSVTLYRQVQIWHDYAETSGRRLVSPGVSQDGLSWLINFRQAYTDTYHTWPRFDALAIHCYLSVDQCKELIGHTNDLAKKWGAKDGTWLTEFAVADPDQVYPFVEWLDAHVGRYAWYTDRLNGTEPWCVGCWSALFDYTTGAATAYGQAYAEAH